MPPLVRGFCAVLSRGSYNDNAAKLKPRADVAEATGVQVYSVGKSGWHIVRVRSPSDTWVELPDGERKRLVLGLWPGTSVDALRRQLPSGRWL